MMLGVVPIGSYFGTLDRVWNGVSVCPIKFELFLKMVREYNDGCNHGGRVRQLYSPCLHTCFYI